MKKFFLTLALLFVGGTVIQANAAAPLNICEQLAGVGWSGNERSLRGDIIPITIAIQSVSKGEAYQLTGTISYAYEESSGSGPISAFCVGRTDNDGAPLAFIYSIYSPHLSGPYGSFGTSPSTGSYFSATPETFTSWTSGLHVNLYPSTQSSAPFQSFSSFTLCSGKPC